MTLVQTVLDHLNQIDDIQTVIYDSGFSANVRIDRKPAPIALLYLLNSWDLDLTLTTYKESAEMQIFFADMCQLDAKGEEKDIIVQRMEAIAKKFLASILADKSIVLVGDSVKIQASYGKFDKFIVGVVVNLKIEEKQASCL